MKAELLRTQFEAHTSKIGAGGQFDSGLMRVDLKVKDVSLTDYEVAIRDKEKLTTFVKGLFGLLPMNGSNNAPYIKKVIFQDPATIVFWSDGVKTVVKAYQEKFDKEKGLAMAIAKRSMGNTSRYYKNFIHFCNEE